MGDPVDPVDRALLDLDESWNQEVSAQPAAAEDRGVNDRTIAGLGVGTPLPMRAAAAPGPSPIAALNPLAHLQPRARRPTHEPHELDHPEQSPLSFVMRASESSVGPQKAESHDMSMFVEGLVADTSPVVETASAGTAMEPVMRRSRKRHQWLVASAIAATAIVGAVLGVHFASSDDRPKIAANEMAALTPADVRPPSPPPALAHTVPAPAAPTAPRTVDEVAPAPADTPPPTTAAAPAEVATVAAPARSAPTVTPVVAIAQTTSKARPATKIATKATPKKAAPKKVATANTTAKKSAKKPSPTKSAVAKKTTAKKPTPAKKVTTSAKAKKTRK